MKVWRDKQGKWITPKEFSERFKKGISEVTQLQQVNSSITFTYMTLIGITCGLVVSVVKYKSLWWLAIILLAAFGNTLVGLIGLIQKRNMLSNLDIMLKQTQEVNNENEQKGLL